MGRLIPLFMSSIYHVMTGGWHTEAEMHLQKKTKDFTVCTQENSKKVTIYSGLSSLVQNKSTIKTNKRVTETVHAFPQSGR